MHDILLNKFTPLQDILPISCIWILILVILIQHILLNQLHLSLNWHLFGNLNYLILM